MLNQAKIRKFDFILLLTVVLVFAIGLAFLYSASYQYAKGAGSAQFLFKQIVWFGLGLMVILIILSVNYQKWLELAYPLYAVNLLLLILVLAVGETRLGAQRWISMGGISFQPAEFSKLIVVFTLARYLGLKNSGTGISLFASGQTLKLKEIMVSFLIVGIPFLLTVKQPDLGTALTLIPILFVMLYIWGAPLKTLGLILGLGMLCCPVFWQMLKPYQKSRILVFINPNADPLGAGYTIIQSKIAIGSGGLFGKGWLSGTQNQLNFLPERHTDFIFSVVGEEWGFLGALLLLVLYFVLIWRAVGAAQYATNVSAKLFACGLVTLILFQVIVNIAMTMGLVPVVGLPLPLISYGGSSLLTTMAAVGFLLNIRMRS